MKYLSIDVETGGLDPAVNSLLEVGCVLADTSKGYIGCPTLRIGVLPEGNGPYVLHPKAAAMNAELLDQLQNNPGAFDRIAQQQIVGNLIFNWLRDNGYEPESDDKIHVNVAGKNVTFDLGFIHAEGIKFRHRRLDPMMLFLRNKDEVGPDLKECCKRAGIDLANFRLHTAVHDAQLVVELIYRGMIHNVELAKDEGISDRNPVSSTGESVG